jgi:hypothetical protein
LTYCYRRGNDCLAFRREKYLARGLPFFEISSVTGQGLDALRYAMAERVLVPR